MSPEPPLDRILGLIRERGGRVTTPRRAIITALLDAEGHVTAEGVAATVQADHPDIHQSTVYRCLETLTGLGVVSHVHLGHGPAVYHLTDELHPHLVCDTCGAVVTVQPGMLDSLGRAVEREFGFQLDATHFALAGRCARCTRSTARPA